MFLLFSILTYLVCSFQGGFDLLGRSIDQIRTTKQVNAAMTTCRSLNLDGLVIIGGRHPMITKGY